MAVPPLTTIAFSCSSSSGVLFSGLPKRDTYVLTPAVEQVGRALAEALHDRRLLDAAAVVAAVGHHDQRGGHRRGRQGGPGCAAMPSSALTTGLAPNGRRSNILLMIEIAVPSRVDHGFGRELAGQTRPRVGKNCSPNCTSSLTGVDQRLTERVLDDFPEGEVRAIHAVAHTEQAGERIAPTHSMRDADASSRYITRRSLVCDLHGGGAADLVRHVLRASTAPPPRIASHGLPEELDFAGTAAGEVPALGVEPVTLDRMPLSAKESSNGLSDCVGSSAAGR